MKKKDYKKCPRCDRKVPLLQDRCPNCGLIFSRLSKVSNTAAKKAIKKGQYNKVIMMTKLPPDVSKKKILLFSIFFGMIGIHFAKVGRYKMFAWGLLATIGLYIASFLPMSWFNQEYLFYLMWGLVLPASIYFIFYIVSVVQIIFNRFKVPVAIDEDYVKESLDKDLVEDIIKEVKIAKKESSVKTAERIKTSKKQSKIRVTCASCGCFVKVNQNEKICPKCEEPLYDD